MGTEASREQSVAVSDVNEIALLHAGHCETAAKSIGPQFNVVCRITHDLHLAGGSG